MSYWEFFLFSKTFKFYNNVHHVREYAQFQDTYSRLRHRSVLFSRSIGELTSWWAKQVLKKFFETLTAGLAYFKSRAHEMSCVATQQFCQPLKNGRFPTDAIIFLNTNI